MRLVVKSDDLDIELETREKYTLVMGLGGAGKTHFVNFVDELRKSEISENRDDILVESDLEYIVVTSKDMIHIIPQYIAEGIKLFISDEFLAHDVVKTLENLEAYCVVITRNPMKDVKMSYKSLYVAYRDTSTNKTCIKLKFEAEQYNGLYDVNAIITEDGKGGADLVKNYVRKEYLIIPAEGDGNIRHKMEDSSGIERLLVICDGGGIAAHVAGIRQVARERKRKGLVTEFLMPECFEQVLLCSAFIGWDKNIYKYFDIKYNNTEDFCEAKIEELSYGKPYFYKHKQQGSLSKCWLINCDKCDTKCEYALQGDKKRLVLENGPLEDLLQLCEGRVEDAMNDMQNLLEDLQRQLSST